MPTHVMSLLNLEDIHFLVENQEPYFYGNTGLTYSSIISDDKYI